ncbi:hypothetical protein J4Q44_G00377720 [Coregonus suidteri]|uniref:Uncharacterized protein n=1 Tax=Coregonus suidteri TaxID=861788 RepID=A0AAN8KID9_9TELE
MSQRHGSKVSSIFNFSTFGYNSHLTGAILVKGGVHQVLTYDHKFSDSRDSDSTSNAVVLQLDIGEQQELTCRALQHWEGYRTNQTLLGRLPDPSLPVSEAAGIVDRDLCQRSQFARWAETAHPPTSSCALALPSSLASAQLETLSWVFIVATVDDNNLIFPPKYFNNESRNGTSHEKSACTNSRRATMAQPRYAASLVSPEHIRNVNLQLTSWSGLCSNSREPIKMECVNGRQSGQREHAVVRKRSLLQPMAVPTPRVLSSSATASAPSCKKTHRERRRKNWKKVQVIPGPRRYTPKHTEQTWWEDNTGRWGEVSDLNERR